MFKFVVKRNSKELFHRALLDNDVFRVRMLLEHVKEDPKFQIDEINEDGLTGLQYSCFSGNLDLVKVLVCHGANLKIKDRDGWSLLHGAAMAGNVDIAKFLIASGAKVVTKNDNGDLPLDIADELPMVVLLLKSMLEQDYHTEVNQFMRKHPQLKKEITREIDAAIRKKKDEIRALEKLPYTKHYDRRRKMSETCKEQSAESEDYSGTYFLLSGDNDIVKPTPRGSWSSQTQVHSSQSRTKSEADRGVGILQSTIRRCSSATNLKVVETDENFNLYASEVLMHNGYDTDQTHKNLDRRRAFIRRVSSPNIVVTELKNVEFRDFSGFHSTYSSGYETDDVEHSQHRPKFRVPCDPLAGSIIKSQRGVKNECPISISINPVTYADFPISIQHDRNLPITPPAVTSLQMVEYPEILL